MKLFAYFLLLCLLASCSFSLREHLQKVPTNRSPSSKTLQASCNKLLARIVESAHDLPEHLQPHVQIIWYPKAWYPFMTHTDLEVGGTFYNGAMGFRKRASLKAAKVRARQKKTRGFFRFSLAVTPEEFEKLQVALKAPENIDRFQSCVGGACHILRENTEIRIPFPFSQVPTLNALYLTIMKKFNHPQILSAQYIGQDMWANVLATGVFSELTAVTAATTAIVIWIVSANKEKKDEVIPVVVPISNNKESLAP